MATRNYSVLNQALDKINLEVYPSVKESDLDLIESSSWRVFPAELKQEIDMRWNVPLLKLRERVTAETINQWFHCPNYGLIICKSTSRFSLVSTYTCCDVTAIKRNQLELGL